MDKTKIVYQVNKQKIENIKKEVEEIVIESKSYEQNYLLNLAKDLDSSYKLALQNAKDRKDKLYVGFNYYSAKTYISLCLGLPYNTYIYFFKALAMYNMYLSISNPKKGKWNLAYYYPLYNRLFEDFKNRIDLFKNQISEEKRHRFYNAIIKCLNSCLKHNSILSVDIALLMLDILRRLIVGSQEIYDEKQLHFIEKIKSDLHLLVNIDTLPEAIKAFVYSILFILTKKELFFHLRNLVPSNKGHVFYVEEDVIRTLNELNQYARNELKYFRKSSKRKFSQPIDEKIKFLLVLSIIDNRTYEYHKFLWQDKDIVSALKVLDKISREIRRHINLIFSVKLVNYFIQEYKFVMLYLKLRVIYEELIEASTQNFFLEWQRILFSELAKDMKNILSKYFKYGTGVTGRRLMIIEDHIIGKFLEFIVFYILKELIEKGDKGIIHSLISGSEDYIKFFFEKLFISDVKDIIWGYKVDNSDIDVLLKGDDIQIALFIKSGALTRKKQEEVLKEIDLALSAGCSFVFQVLDFSRNPQIIRDLSQKYNNDVIFIDIRIFLEKLIELAKKHKDIYLELSKSGILNYAGFYY